MIGSETAQVFAEHPRTAGRVSQMMDSRGRLEINLVTCVTPSVRKFRFKIIGDPHESLVKTANFEGDVAAYGKISCHKLFDPSRPNACKGVVVDARKINACLPTLDDAVSHQAGIGQLVSIGVGLNKPWFRKHIIVDEQYDLAPRLNEAAVHGTWNQRLRQV